MSFIKYAPLESAQKITKALKDIKKVSGSKIDPKKTGAANTLKFFSHCLGLAVRRIW